MECPLPLDRRRMNHLNEGAGLQQRPPRVQFRLGARSSVDRALASGVRGRRFESCRAYHHLKSSCLGSVCSRDLDVRLARNVEQLPETLAGLRVAAFTWLMLHPLLTPAAQSQ
jgi:hypothetical protein